VLHRRKVELNHSKQTGIDLLEFAIFIYQTPLAPELAIISAMVEKA
jgi:hypothetical protein